MAKRKKRKNQKQKKATVTIVVMLVIIALIMGFFVYKALGSVWDLSPETPTTTEYVWNDEDGYTQSDNTDSHEDILTEQSTTEATTQETTQTPSESEREESTTESPTAPDIKTESGIKAAVLSYYTDLIGYSEDDLYIDDDETTRNGDKYTFTLRVNGVANSFIGDVTVNKGNGKVTDSMGNDSWNIYN